MKGRGGIQVFGVEEGSWGTKLARQEPSRDVCGVGRSTLGDDVWKGRPATRRDLPARCYEGSSCEDRGKRFERVSKGWCTQSWLGWFRLFNGGARVPFKYDPAFGMKIRVAPAPRGPGTPGDPWGARGPVSSLSTMPSPMYAAPRPSPARLRMHARRCRLDSRRHGDTATRHLLHAMGGSGWWAGVGAGRTPDAVGGAHQWQEPDPPMTICNAPFVASVLILDASVQRLVESFSLTFPFSPGLASSPLRVAPSAILR